MSIQDTLIAIDPASYVDLMDDYAKAFYRVRDIGDTLLLDAVNVILNSTYLYTTVDLLSDFYNTYLVSGASLASSSPFLQAVRKLNAHILSRTDGNNVTYTSIGTSGDATSYFAKNVSHFADGTVPQSWADLNAAVGQTIASHYVGADAF